MKLIFMEYLASLDERGELDVVMPDLLSETGMTVLSKPGIGTKQYGVDVAAIGKDADGTRKVYLLSIKPGDLKRADWDTGLQGLRTSLNQIKDVYIPRLIPKRYADLPIVVVLCIGGDLREDVRDDVNGYMDTSSSEAVQFDLWNGDHLSELLLSGILREKSLPSTWQSDFRKCVAMVDEPQIAFAHFCRLLHDIASQCRRTRPARLTAIRQMYIALWTVYVWARGTGNIEAPFLCAERAVLVSWPLIKDYLSGKSKAARGLTASMERLVTLYRLISADYLAKNVVPRAPVRHGLASAVPSQASLDVNIRLFDVLGRIGLHGLWELHAYHVLQQSDQSDDAEQARKALSETADLLIYAVRNNPVLWTPIKDNQAVDIDIACLFLNKLGHDEFIRWWIGQVTRATVFAFNNNAAYPCVFNDYRDLLNHPRDGDAYRTEATAGSILVPTLAVWSSLTGDAETLRHLAEFTSGPFRHSTLQLLYPGSDTEQHLYEGTSGHGLNANGFTIPESPNEMLSLIRSECNASPAFNSLSVLEFGLWPLIVLACRHHRQPLPPHFWPIEETS